jgi:hypothetical protein
LKSFGHQLCPTQTIIRVRSAPSFPSNLNSNKLESREWILFEKPTSVGFFVIIHTYETLI